MNEKIQYCLPQLPIDIYVYMAQKIDDIDTLLNYFNSCKILRQIFLLAPFPQHNTNLLFTKKLPTYNRQYATCLDYMHSCRFTINIEKIKSYRVFGLVTDMPESLLKQITFNFYCQRTHISHTFLSQMLIIDHGTYREVILDEGKSHSKYQCTFVHLYVNNYRHSISLNCESEILLGRNAIYKEMETIKIQHTASSEWVISSGKYIISFYTGLPRLE